MRPVPDVALNCTIENAKNRQNIEKLLQICLNSAMESADLQDVQQALVQHWGVRPLAEKRIDLDAILDELCRRVDFMLQHDFERLTACMYTIDVSEERFSEALKLPEKDKPARAIAQLILEREVEKMESRKRYTRMEDLPSSSED